MTRLGFAAAALAGLLTLGGCGSENSTTATPFTTLLEAAKGKVKGQQAEAPALTRAAVDQFPQPLILARIESRGVTGALAPSQRNGADVTWASSDLVGVILRDGVMRGTRGLGEDLMSADIPSAASLRQDGAVTRRSYFHLDGNEQTQRLNYTCNVYSRGEARLVILERSYNSMHYAESCQGDGPAFINEYWFLNSGKIVQSRQWVSRTVGFLKLQNLKP